MEFDSCFAHRGLRLIVSLDNDTAAYTKRMCVVLIFSILFDLSSAFATVEQSRLKGIAEYKAGNYPQSEEVLKGTIADAERSEPGIVAELLLDLANVYQKVGRFAEARSCLRKAIERIKKTEGENSLKLVFPMNRFMEMLETREDRSAAAAMCKEGLRILEASFGQTSPALLPQLKLVHACTLFSSADVPYIGRIYEIYQQQPNFHKSETAPSICSDYAVALCLSGQPANAEGYAKEGLEIALNVFGKADSHALASLGALVMAMDLQRKSSESDQLFRQLISHIKQLKSPRQTDVERTYTLGTIFMSAAMYKHAASTFDETILLQKQHGLATCDSLKKLNLNASKAKFRIGGTKQARQLIQQFVKDEEISYGSNRLALAKYLTAEASTAMAERLFELAALLYEKALSVYASSGKGEPADIVIVMKRLGRVYRKLGDDARSEKIMTRGRALAETCGIKWRGLVEAREGK